MKKQIIARCQELGIGFRRNKKTLYRYQYTLITFDRGVVGFDYLADVQLYLDCLENETDFQIEYSDQ